ncbi:unnamed protein product [Caretta caretta]
MVTRIPDSVIEKLRMKYSCVRQALKLISLELNQKMLNILSRIDVDRTRHLSCDHHPRPWAHTGSQGDARYMQETPFCLSVGNLLSYSMSDSNSTDFTNLSTFILLGIPGLEAAHVWISIPFCAIYAIAILGNFTILFIVKREPSLHGPMYYFLCMLVVADVVPSTAILPKMLSIFRFNSREINFSACLTQMFCLLSFSSMHSGILVAMAFDRYVAICDPLRHSTTLTNPVVAKIGLAVVLRGIMLVLPYLFEGEGGGHTV